MMSCQKIQVKNSVIKYLLSNDYLEIHCTLTYKYAKNVFMTGEKKLSKLLNCFVSSGNIFGIDFT
jgi:hypothetical protein